MGYYSDDWCAKPPLAELVNGVHHTDLFELCDMLPDQSIDMILCDLPYGTTACSWDTVIPFAPMWERFKRVIKPRGAIVLTASQPFTSALVMSNPTWFKYSWVWDKVNGASGMHAQIQPLKTHEDICVFGNGVVAYYPEMTRATRRVDRARHIPNGAAFSGGSALRRYDNSGAQFPKSIIEFSNANQTDKLHPTQKPVALFRYLIRTYTRAGELVLDPCVGSGTSAIAAREEQRNFICGDTSAEYVEVARKRLDAPYTLPLFQEQPA